MADKITVGFIGIGFMGSGMVRNLAAAGFNVVIFNRTASKAENIASEFENVQVAESPAAVAKLAPFVCLCLASEQQIEDVMNNETTGLLSAIGLDHIIIDHSTVSPTCTAKMYAACQTKGAMYSDCPVSGGPEGAANGTLAIMCGADEATFGACGPLFQAMGSCVELMGGLGAGTATKLANQLLVGCHAAASVEALQLGKRLGITDMGKLLSVLNNSWGQSRILARCGGLIQKVEETNDPSVLHESAAPLRNLHKDLTFVQAAAKGANVDTPVTTVVTELYANAMKAGFSEADMAVLYNNQR
eukprot:m.133718 g.133718  ORF g.133718 m.133718 type:complete len:302 (+) comp29691_c1_seq4:182-1087(+)